MCAVYLNRGRFVLLFTFIPIIICLIFSDKILIGMGMPEEASYYAKIYLVHQIPGLLLQSQFDCMMRYLNCMHKSHIPMIVQITSTCCHLFWCNLFVHTLNMGIVGASYAICITYGSNFFILMLYTCVFQPKYRNIWKYDPLIFEEWGSYLKLGVPGAFMLMADYWVY